MSFRGQTGARVDIGRPEDRPTVEIDQDEAEKSERFAG